MVVGAVVRITWAVAFVGKVSTVVGSVTLPGGSEAQCGKLTLLKRHPLHTQVEVTGAVCGHYNKQMKIINKNTLVRRLILCILHQVKADKTLSTELGITTVLVVVKSFTQLLSHANVLSWRLLNIQ